MGLIRLDSSLSLRLWLTKGSTTSTSMLLRPSENMSNVTADLPSTVIALPGSTANESSPPTDRPVRVYADGIYDLFHFGHARSLSDMPRNHGRGVCPLEPKTASPGPKLEFRPPPPPAIIETTVRSSPTIPSSASISCLLLLSDALVSNLQDEPPSTSDSVDITAKEEGSTTSTFMLLRPSKNMSNITADVPSTAVPLPGSTANESSPPTDRPVRIYADGIYDLFHFGHARSLLDRPRNRFQTLTFLWDVATMKRHISTKERTVMTAEERYESLRHCNVHYFHTDSASPLAWGFDHWLFPCSKERGSRSFRAFPLFRKPKSEEDEESRRDRGKGSVEKYFHILPEDNNKNSPQDLQAEIRLLK
ncbi:hypothetical protein DY000_02004307 [Brassica cretica]|uniref:choline-phosphate cytidylyltransferase n=1 Tax=Brassica cretica TaxID=69181 RepID=A0ABQ7C683_BRACR|nr:hypothetical protein DY000_02004307 [Brassica cretica]